MVSTQKAFLRRLHLALIWRMRPHDIQDVMADYEGFFAEHLREGKSEADICRAFGTPSETAQTILREEGGNAQPRGLLLFVCVVLAWLLNGRWLFHFFGLLPLSLLQITLIPLLWRSWRDVLPVDSSLRRKGATALCWGVPTAVWAVVYGYTCWLVFAFLPRWQALSKAEQQGGSRMGQLFGHLFRIGSALLFLSLLGILLYIWWSGSIRLLPSETWCMGGWYSITRIYFTLSSMDISTLDSYSLVVRDIVLNPLLTLLLVGVGGVAVTAWLVRKGGRKSHGRTT